MVQDYVFARSYPSYDPGNYALFKMKTFSRYCGTLDYVATNQDSDDPIDWAYVAGWAITKAGSRRRRGYNVDSSWTEAALSRWLTPHGRSAS